MFTSVVRITVRTPAVLSLNLLQLQDRLVEHTQLAVSVGAQDVGAEVHVGKYSEFFNNLYLYIQQQCPNFFHSLVG